MIIADHPHRDELARLRASVRSRPVLTRDDRKRQLAADRHVNGLICQAECSGVAPSDDEMASARANVAALHGGDHRE